MDRINTIFSFMKMKAKLAVLCNTGAAAVEFAFLAPTLLVIVLGVVDYGMAMLNKMELQSAARAGAQYALGDSTDTTAITTTVVNATNLGITSGDVTLECYCLDTATEALASTTCGASTCLSAENVLMTVTAAQSYNFMFGVTTLNLTGVATVQVEK